ncbi:two-component system response regulator [Desulfuromonas versatilis]|uniref:Two-component system response regulator n=1 Tax=Desulfuromonas versatilis TaxID=2802975 RepID=A0ABM8I252_9BACT|nr:response regulator [Desulfuromonas versatilis]BCR06734.1 two-component system response regulator [Desulfuromonas versatilis]
MSKRKRFGEILVEAKVVSQEVLDKALQVQKSTGKRLGQVLEDMGVVSERDTAVALARQFGFKTVQNLAKYSFPEDILKLVPSETALKLSIFPLKREGKTLYLAMVNPLDMDVIDNLSFQTGLRVAPCVTTAGEIQAAVHQHYLGGRPNEPEGQETADWWTILVVDDQELVRSAILAALKREGYNTVEAANGADGLKLACQNPPHLIISDTVMPRMDGFEMFRALQANNTTRNIPVMALSSKSAPEEEAKLLDAGYFDFIPKPINPVRLGARVRRALRVTYGPGGPPPR